VARMLDAIDPDQEDAKAREMCGLAPEQEPTEVQVKDAQQALRAVATAPIAHNPALCQTLLEVRRRQEQTIDETSVDEVTRSEAAPGRAPDYDRQLVESFRAFIEENRDTIDALQILYARPYGQRLTRKQIRELADAIETPPRRWTAERLWAAYEKVDKDRVRGARLWTDIVSLARHALRPAEDLVPFADQVHERFTRWLSQQTNRGRTFTDEQMRWLTLIRDRIAGDAEVRPEDFDDVPFVTEGGLGRFYELFGEEYERLVAELNAELVA
jgi:type I restriction enzyme, R subunit